jgi:hypothetical protein
MSGFLPDFSRKKQALDGLSKNKGLSIYHRHLTEHPDGRKEGGEQTFDFSTGKIIEGGEWMHNPDKPVFDSIQQHSRTDSKSAVYKERHFFEDKDGTRISDEFVTRMNDFDTSHGTRMIGNSPETDFDPRFSMLESFPRDVVQIPSKPKTERLEVPNESRMGDMRPLPGKWDVQS